MSEQQRCAICGAGGKLVLDHDHATGEVRGWLCSRCNVMLGYAADSQERLRRAADYLARPPGVAPGAVTEIEPGSRKQRPSRAAYMREYRARPRSQVRGHEFTIGSTSTTLAEPVGHVFNSRPFTPVPKSGH